MFIRITIKRVPITEKLIGKNKIVTIKKKTIEGEIFSILFLIFKLLMEKIKSNDPDAISQNLVGIKK